MPRIACALALQNDVCPSLRSHVRAHAVTVRLSNGTATSGRLEVYNAGEWGTVCSTDFDARDAYVACNQLLPGTYGIVSSSAAFGSAVGRIWLSGLQCQGTEARLERCRHESWGFTPSCDHGMDVALTCLPAPNGRGVGLWDLLQCGGFSGPRSTETSCRCRVVTVDGLFIEVPPSLNPKQCSP
jgi:hypothetical protein